MSKYFCLVSIKIHLFILINMVLRLHTSSLIYFWSRFLISTKVNCKLLRKLKFGSSLGSFPEIEEISNSVHVRNYSLSRSALRVTSGYLWVIYRSPERPAAGNTCASMEILRILGPKPHQIDEFWGDFLNFFRSL